MATNQGAYNEPRHSIIQPRKIDTVRKALDKGGFYHKTVNNVPGCGRRKGVSGETTRYSVNCLVFFSIYTPQSSFYNSSKSFPHGPERIPCGAQIYPCSLFGFAPCIGKLRPGKPHRGPVGINLLLKRPFPKTSDKGQFTSRFPDIKKIPVFDRIPHIAKRIGGDGSGIP
ncbi:MAG: hypothetical protein JXA71_11970 [Chitinispirillaceae bacterium]|nr:hypothetical protein [Chitinispirillaceae bacterium]